MAVVIDGTTGITAPANTVLGNLSYTGTLTGNGGIINLGSGQVYKDASGNVGIGTSAPAKRLHVFSSTSAEVATLESTVLSSDNVQLRFKGFSGERWAIGNNVATGGTGVNFDFYDLASSALRARIDSSGNLLIGATSYSGGVPNDSAIVIRQDGYMVTRVAANGNYAAEFQNASGTGVGNITVNSGSTQYVTSSDYRLKEDITPMTDALTTVAALKPVAYKWKATGEATQGFIAHELQAVVPECVVGEKDAVDSEGNPQYQGIDTSFLVATLAAAIQELKAIVDTQAISITALNERLTALEAPIV